MADNYSVKYIFEAVDKMSRNLKTIESNINGLGLDMDMTARKAKTFSQKMQTASTKLRAFGNSMRYISLAAAGAAAVSVRAFAKMEKGIIDTQGLLDREGFTENTTKLETMQKEVLKLGFSLDDANESLFKNISYLEMGEHASKAFAEAQRLAIGGNTDLASSVSAISNIMNAYGKETTSASEVANAFFSAQVKGAINVQQLADNIGKVTPFAAPAGIGFKEILSTASALTLGGLEPEMATTALRAALRALTKPSPQAAKYLEGMGVSYGRVNLESMGLLTIIKQIIKAEKKFPQYIDMAIPNIRAAAGIFQLTDERLQMIEKMLLLINKSIKDGSGLQDNYNRVLKSTWFNLRKVKGFYTLISGIIGKDLAPFVKKLSDYTEQFYNWLEKLDPKFRQLIVFFGMAVAALSPLAIGLSILAKILGSAVLVALGLVVLKIALLVAGITALIVYWDDLTAAIKEAYSWLVNFGEKMSFGIRFDPFDAAAKYMKVEKTSKVIGEQSLTQKEFFGRLDVNLNAPKGTVKNYSSVTEGTGLNLGLNMGF